jgi:hypothetical protein
MMAGNRIVTLGSYEITTKPVGFWRRKLFDAIPYWQASTPKFEVIFKSTAHIPASIKFIFRLRFENTQSDNLNSITLSDTKTGDINSVIVSTKPLVYTGDTFLTVMESHVQNEQSIYCFHTTNRSWLALAILAGILAGLFATFGNVIVAIINQD